MSVLLIYVRTQAWQARGMEERANKLQAFLLLPFHLTLGMRLGDAHHGIPSPAISSFHRILRAIYTAKEKKVVQDPPLKCETATAHTRYGSAAPLNRETKQRLLAATSYEQQ